MITERVLAEFKARTLTAQEAVRAVRSGDRVYIGSNCGQPITLCRALTERRHELSGVEIIHLIVFGETPHVAAGLAESFHHTGFFVGANTRAAVQEGRADYVPIFLSEIPALFKSGQCPLDIALVTVSPPDEHGFCSLGISVDIGLAACKSAKHIIAEVNPNMPRTLGEGFLHISEIDAFVPTETPMLEHLAGEIDEVSEAIGQHIARLIDDGDTLQTGIGKIPSAVLNALVDKQDLGVHTEMFSDPLVEAIRRGNINCRKKSLHPNRVISTFCIGTRACYETIDNNPFFHFAPTEYVNDPFVIAQNDRMIAINGALEVDLTGQVVSDSIGHKPYSGIGGQVDFIRGASRSKGGKPIIALPSTAKGGTLSRIVVRVAPGAGVVTSRGDVHYVVTEFGVAYLHGKSIRERALSLIRIAHPDFRDRLLAEAKEIGLIPTEQPSVQPEYPHERVREVESKDGKAILLRPIRPTDDQLLRRHFYSLSPESVQRRFNRMVRTLTAGTVRDLVNPDYKSHMAMVAVLQEGEAETLLATARYYVNEANNTAELAMAVLDDWQNRGLGRQLLRSLIEHAQQTRLSALIAYVRPDNIGMVHLLQTCGVPMEERLEEGMRLFTLWLRPARTPLSESDADPSLPLSRSSP